MAGASKTANTIRKIQLRCVTAGSQPIHFWKQRCDAVFFQEGLSKQQDHGGQGGDAADDSQQHALCHHDP